MGGLPGSSQACAGVLQASLPGWVGIVITLSLCRISHSSRAPCLSMRGCGHHFQFLVKLLQWGCSLLFIQRGYLRMIAGFVFVVSCVGFNFRMNTVRASPAEWPPLRFLG